MSNNPESFLPEENKKTVRLFFEEVCNKNKTELIPKVFSESFIFNGEAQTHKDVTGFLDSIKKTFDDPHVTVIEQFAEGDMVSTKRTWTGIPKEVYGSQPATRTLMTWTEVSVVQMKNGKIVDDWKVQSELIPVHSPQELNDKQLDFVIKEYQSKVQYLKDHFTRMLTRFNYFVILQAAILGGKILQTTDDKWILPLFGIFLSVFWYIFGAQDRYLVDLYRTQIKEDWRKISQNLLLKETCYTGETDNGRELGVKKYFLQWRNKNISTTHLTALFPLLMLAIWVIIIIVARI